MNKKCQNCSHRGITLLRMEIFNKGVLSIHEKAYRRITALCKNCGEIIIEEEVKCPICNKANVKICLAKRIGFYEKFEGIDYLLRCKNCGYIWRAHFKNIPKQNSIKNLNILIKNDRFKEA
ncbi:MAG: hypothetical protein QXE19_00705 [Candidatus Bathyarchaeia archaeon]